MLAVPPQLRSNTAPLVGGLLILAMGAIAMALPPSPIATQSGSGGLATIESPGLFSAGVAEQNAANGFGYLVLDVSAANLDQHSLWRSELDLVAQRRFAVWGWIDTARAIEPPEKLISSLNFAGVYVCGPDAVDIAASLRSVSQGRPVIPVVGAIADRPDAGNYGVIVDLETWLKSDGEIARPILIADQLSETDVVRALNHARDLAGDDGTPTIVIARVPVR